MLFCIYDKTDTLRRTKIIDLKIENFLQSILFVLFFLESVLRDLTEIRCRIVMPTDIVNSVTIKLEPGLDQIIESGAETTRCSNENQLGPEFSYYTGTGPRWEKFSKHLTVAELVRIHFDPFISQFDLSQQ